MVCPPHGGLVRDWSGVGRTRIVEKLADRDSNLVMDFSLTSLPAQLVIILTLGIVTASWLGFGVSALLLPRELLPYRWLLMPVVGMMGFALIAQPLALAGVNSAGVIWILFALSLALNGLAIWRGRLQSRQQVTNSTIPEWAKISRLEILVPLLIAAGAIVLGLLPLFGYGYITVTGYNMDASSYVAQAEFAKQFGLNTALVSTIPSIYAQTVVYVIQTGTGSIGPLWVSVLSQLWGRDSFYAYTPLLVLAYGFSFLSVFVLYRIVFQLKFWTGVLALGALELNGIYLLIPLDNFAPHTFALAVVPFELTIAYLYLTTRTRRALLLAVLALDAQLLSYPESTPFFLFPILVALAWQLVVVRKQIWREVVGLAQIGGLSVVLAPTAYWTLYESVRHQSGTVALAIGGTIVTFISPAEGLGLNALRVTEFDGLVQWDAAVRNGWNVAAWLGVGSVLLLMVVGLISSLKRQGGWLAACGIVYGALLAWMFFVQKYPYGFFKTFATSVFVLAALMALGTQTWRDALRGSAVGKRFVFAPAAILIFLFLLLGASMAWVQAALAERAPVVTRKLLQLSNSDLIPPNASIYLSLTKRSNPRMYWAAYLLRDHPLYGNGLVAYSSLTNAQEGVVYDFALLKREENPVEFDYAPDSNVWEDRWTILYQKK